MRPALCITPNPALDAVNFDVQVVQEPCGPYAGQEWRLLDVNNSPPGYFYLQNDTYTTKCLYASGGAYRNNALIELATCEVEAVEIWALG